MTSVVQFGVFPVVSSRAIEVPDYNLASQGRTLSIERLPNEPIGTFTLTLTNVVVGSSVQVEPQAGGAPMHSSIAAASTVVILLSAYGIGSPSNNLRVKVGKGSAPPYYKRYETLVTAKVGEQPVFVAQIPD